MSQTRISRAFDDIQPYYISGQGASVAATAAYGTTGFYWYKFTDNAAKDEELQFSFQLPHRRAADTPAHLHLHVVPSANGGAGNNIVVWKWAYQWVNIGDAFSTTTNTSGSASQTISATGANKHTLFELAEITGTGKTLSSDLVVIISRLSKTSASDNYTGDMWLRYIDLHCEIDSLGSMAETTN